MKALTYAKTLVNISDEEINTTDIWISENGHPDFDVTMGNFDLCIVGGSWFIYSPQFGWEVGKHKIGLYRHDGSACFEYTSEPQSD